MRIEENYSLEKHNTFSPSGEGPLVYGIYE